jgi:hypothetical protein
MVKKQSAARQTSGQSNKPEPTRARVTIPAADVATLKWWDLQDDPHASVRMLVHDEIERNGYTDRVNRIEPRTCTGHPPLTEEVVMQLMSLLERSKAQQPVTNNGTGVGVDGGVSREAFEGVGLLGPSEEPPRQTHITKQAPAKTSPPEAGPAAASAVEAPVEPVAEDNAEGELYDLDDL